MKKKTKSLVEKLKFRSALVALVAVSVIGVGYGVKAYQNNAEQAPDKVFENVENYYEAEVPTLETKTLNEVEDVFGAASRDYSVSPFIDVNGDVIYHLQQTFIDASTTIVSIPDPFLVASSTGVTMPVLRTDGTIEWLGATSTVEMARLYITGAATTSYWVECGAAANASATSSVDLIHSGTVATSTLATIENDLLEVQGGDGSSDATSTSKILLTPNYPYFTCVVHLDDITDSKAFTQTGNTFAGKIWLRVSRSRF